MELRHLRYFLAVAEEGSITRAAARLYVGQPSLSRQLRDLERAVGDVLLHRSARGIELTDAGSRLLPEARAAITAFDAVTTTPGDADADPRSGRRARLVVGTITPDVAAELGPPLLAAARRAMPGVATLVRLLPFSDHVRALAERRVDVLVGAGPPPDGVAVTTLFLEPRALLARRDDPRCAVDVITAAEAAALPLLYDIPRPPLG